MSRALLQPRLAAAALVAAGALAGAAVVLLPTDAGRPLDQGFLASVLPAPESAGAATAAAGARASSFAALRTLLGVSEKGLEPHSAVYQQARKVLPERFAEYETRRFVLLSDARPRWTRRQAQLLERTYHQYNRYMRRLGIEPQPLRHKLVCVLFQEYDQYRDFARDHDDVTSAWISGYYSPKHDRIVFYNIETNPDFAPDRRAGADGEDHAIARSRVSEEFEAAATATTIHEAIHQLAFHTRVQSAQIQNPLWFSEGLATSFETDRPDESFGPDRDYPLRREQFDELLAGGTLIPLRELVTYAQMPDNRDETIAAVYHESYALVTWLSRFRTAQLRLFIETLRDEPPGRPTPQRHLEIFEQAFGDVDRLDSAWQHYERSRLEIAAVEGDR